VAKFLLEKVARTELLHGYTWGDEGNGATSTKCLKSLNEKAKTMVWVPILVIKKQVKALGNMNMGIKVETMSIHLIGEI
ncbi:hypothetical protein HAX54_007109, partial [Datura stramonium]|nr:hypothetical protein [Datura stramonium]